MPSAENILKGSALVLVLLYASFVLSLLIPLGGVEPALGSPRPGARFLQSFAFTGILLSVGYVAALAAWAALRRKWTFLVRHVAVAGTMSILVVLYLNALGGFIPTAFNIGNVVGVVALAYAIVLTVTSNDASQRWLNRGWSWLMARATTMWLLVLVHAWIFAYYVEGPTGPRGGTLWASFWFVLLLQTMAFGRTAWLRRRNVARPGPLMDEAWNNVSQP